MSFKKLAAYVANITDSLRRANAIRKWGWVDFGHRRHRRDRGTGLAMKYVNLSFGVCFLGLTLRHKRSELVLYGNR
jgi:hypothetical protein